MMDERANFGAVVLVALLLGILGVIAGGLFVSIATAVDTGTQGTSAAGVTDLFTTVYKLLPFALLAVLAGGSAAIAARFN